MWVSIVIIIVGAEICALALILTRRWRQEHPKRYQKTPIAGDVFGVIGTGFAVILAFVIFMIVRSANKMKRKAEEAAPAADPEEVQLLREIRDALKKG